MSIEDQQAEANENIVELIENVTDPDAKAKYQLRWDEALELFSDGYEGYCDDMMYDGLEELQDLSAELGRVCVE